MRPHLRHDAHEEEVVLPGSRAAGPCGTVHTLPLAAALPAHVRLTAAAQPLRHPPLVHTWWQGAGAGGTDTASAGTDDKRRPYGE